MTFDDDCVRIAGHVLACRNLGVEWPPPERLSLAGLEFVRVSMSQITDAERSQTTHIFRGAEYLPLEGAK